MRAAVIRGHGGREVIRLENDFPEPAATGGWVKIRVRACSLNHHDIFSRRGMPGIRLDMPLITGSDIAGEIADVSDGVSGWRVGERVLIDPNPCPETNWKFIGEQLPGGRAEYCLVHHSQLLALPDEVSWEAAACLPLAFGTAYRMLVTIGRVRRGELVLILGASGGVGTACVLLCKLLGCEVIACAGSEDKLERLRGLGADHLVNYHARNFREAVIELTGKPRVMTGEGGVQVAVNATGGGTFKDTMRCLRKAGRLLSCGATAGFEEQIDVSYLWSYEHQILGSDGWSRSDLHTLLDHVAAGTLQPVIDRIMPLAEVQEAERLMEERAVFGKIVLSI